jgi:glycosyltransferase involved in cell wall biosynthesis
MATVERQMTPKIHFLVPFRSNVQFLRDMLTSIHVQTIRDWKVTVVNDSADQAEVDALVKTFDDERFSVLHNPTSLGIGGNWKTALAAAEAEFAALVHADDTIAPTYAQTVLDLHDRYPGSYGVFTGARIIDQRGRMKRFSAPDIAKKILHPFLREPCIVEGDDGLRSLLRGNFIFCPTVTYRVSRLIPPVFDESLKMSLDLQSFADAILRGERFVGTKAIHYSYRRHSASTTATLNADASRFDEELRTYRRIADSAGEAGFSGSASTGRRALIVKCHLAYLIITHLFRGKFGHSLHYARMLRS